MKRQMPSSAFFQHRRMSGFTQTAVAGALLILLTALMVNARALLSPVPAVKPSMTSPTKLETAASLPAMPSAVRQSRAAKERLGSEIITLTHRGFEPADINRTGGRFFLTFENRSRLPSITLHLDREQGGNNRMLEVILSREQPDWIDEVNLPPGRYTLSEAAHPAWVCHISITAH